MFDKTFLCKQGNEFIYGNTKKTLHALLRDKQVTLIEGSVQVYFLAGFKGDPSSLRDLTASGDGKTLKIGDKVIDQLVNLTCKFSMLSELHVVAWGNSNSNPENPIYGNCVVVVVSGCALIAAWSDEDLLCNDKLKMTFDIEETNGVLQAKADFDGTITQGIFDKLHDYNTLLNKPTIGNGTVNLSVYEGLSVSQDSVKPVGNTVSEQTFSVNQQDASSLFLGAAALRGVNEIFDGQTPLLDYVPTSSAVIGYVSKLGYITQDEAYGLIGKGTLTISKGTGSIAFSANSVDSTTITFGTAADANVCTEIHQEAQQGTTTELNNAQLSSLVTLQQARQIADESTSNSKSLTPTAAGSNEDIVIEKGAMVWLAVHFIGEVGITDFTTSNDYLKDGLHEGETPTWSGTASTGTDAYIAKLNDNAGDFYATARKIAADHKFRTMNAMDVSGMAEPSYGFALCLCIESPA